MKNGHFAPGNQLFKMAIFRALLNYLRALLNFYARKNLKKNSSIVDQSVIHPCVQERGKNVTLMFVHINSEAQPTVVTHTV